MAAVNVKRITKNIVSLVVGELTSHLFGFLATVYLARILLPEGFGWLSLAQAFLIYLLVVVEAGLSIYGTREIAKDKNTLKYYVTNITLIKLSIASVIFIAALMIVLFLPLPVFVKLIFAGTFLTVFQRALAADWVFQGIEKMEYIGLSRSLYKIVLLVLVYLFIKGSQALVLVPYIDFFSAFAVAVLFFAILMRGLRISRADIQLGQWYSLLKNALPLGLAVLFVQLYYNLDMIMLGFMKNAKEVGLYSAAYKIFWIIFGFFLLWQQTIFPVATRLLAENKEKAKEMLEKYLRLTLWIGIPVIVYLFVAAASIIRVVFGVNYQASGPLLQILIWTLLPMIIGGVYGQLILIPIGKQQSFLNAVVLGTILNFLINLLLIPPFGNMGSAIATVLSEIGVVLLSWLYAKNEITIKVAKWLTKPFLGIAVACLANVLVMNYVPMNIFGLMVSAVIFFIIYFILTAFIMGEKEILFEYVNKLIKQTEHVEANDFGVEQ